MRKIGIFSYFFVNFLSVGRFPEKKREFEWTALIKLHLTVYLNCHGKRFKSVKMWFQWVMGLFSLFWDGGRCLLENCADVMHCEFSDE